MTAVIGIINKSAAAIAADSAVTVTGPKGPKIFNRANKIFRLSKRFPVGLMLYNQGEFMGTPWETIIKQYRKDLGDNSFATLAEYKEDFIKYLHSKDFYCGVDQQKIMIYYLIIDFVGSLVSKVIQDQQVMINSQPPDLIAQLSRLVTDKILQQLAYYETLKDSAEEMADFTEKEFYELDLAALPNWIQQVSTQHGIPINYGTIEVQLKKLIFLHLKSNVVSNFYTGLVFSGFGEDEIFPGLQSIKISIAINKRLRYINDPAGTVCTSHLKTSYIRPFAQTDVIDTILSGIDPRLSHLYFQHFEDFTRKNNEVVATMVESKDPKLAAAIRTIKSSDLTKRLQELIAVERKKQYIQPLMGAVGTLSKEDLSEMAESLIYLTYLKRRFTFAEESVGGPVDVAVITKGDGFIWMKRKHYFTKDLNVHFFQNY